MKTPLISSGLTILLILLASCSEHCPYRVLSGSYLRYNPLGIEADSLLRTEVLCLTLRPDSSFCRMADVILIEPSGMWESADPVLPQPESGTFRKRADTLTLYFDNVILLWEQELRVQGDTLHTLWYKVASGLNGPADDYGPDRYLKNGTGECILSREKHAAYYRQFAGKVRK